MEDVNIRFKKLINELTLGAQNKFAAEIRVPASTISSIVGGKRIKPGYDILHKIKLRYENVNIDWLVTGEGDMIIGEEVLVGNFNNPSEKSYPNQSEIFLQQLAEKDKQISSLLKIIENNGLGKDEVIVQEAVTHDRTAVRRVKHNDQAAPVAA